MLPAVKKGERQGFHLIKQRATDMQNDPLPDGSHEKLLQKPYKPVREIEGGEKQQKL